MHCDVSAVHLFRACATGTELSELRQIPGLCLSQRREVGELEGSAASLDHRPPRAIARTLDRRPTAAGEQTIQIPG